ncbi:hypothetical protein N7472_001856 [Penicillium cf. griseofulvum]|uniref:Mso1 N-terminal domain-containing protein n=1 Tax=Penicillium cf. griseofulvum TaxID=2972120 RepID=A0A9W9MQ81_9EURO|nr:hypothetical protein N7472_001856 [Penicillium cf. griseofulvum]KAJ5437415.1 hypothetical protein N7445_005959 [Penicillium cf. griseofulvum]
MSSYFSSLTTSSAISGLGSRLTNLRRAITLGDEGDDPDNEDCSHISNALRAYYAEKGRPFPPWLPQDPKGPSPPPSRPIATSQLPSGGYSQGSANTGRNGGLGDLWGDAPSQTSHPQTASLRRGRGGTAPPLASSHSAPSGPSSSPGPALTLSQSHSPAGSGSPIHLERGHCPASELGRISLPRVVRISTELGRVVVQPRTDCEPDYREEGLLVLMLTLVFGSLLERLGDGESADACIAW